MRYIFLGLFLLFLAGCADTVNPPDSDASMLSGIVSHVVDGDTIDVSFDTGKEERVRLLLIDTPETVHPSKPVEPFGPEASSYTKETLLNRQVQIEFDVAERDQYGRLLAYVWVDGRMFNEMLLEEGLARVVIYQPNVKYVDEFRKIEREAQQRKVGIWSIEDYSTSQSVDSPPLSKAQFIASKNSGVYHEVDCPGGATKIAANNAVYFASENEAKQSGRRMCHSKSCPLHDN